MPDVDRWLAADEPEGLTLRLDVLKPSEVGVLEGVKLTVGVPSAATRGAQ